MKKQLVITGLVGSLVAFGALSAQAFQSKQTAVVVASATTGGTLSASFTLTLHPVTSTASLTSGIGWTNAIPGSGWKIADQMMKLAWSVTDTGGGIQIYTDNTGINGAATPQFVDPTPGDHTNSDSNPAGLVQVPATGNTSNSALPVAWSIKAGTATVGVNLLPAEPNDVPADPNASQWLYMEDKGQTVDIPTTKTTAFANADPYITMAKFSGIHFGQAPTEFGSDNDHVSFVYMQANFASSAAQTSYKSSRVTVEAFIQ